MLTASLRSFKMIVACCFFVWENTNLVLENRSGSHQRGLAKQQQLMVSGAWYRPQITMSSERCLVNRPNVTLDIEMRSIIKIMNGKN